MENILQISLNWHDVENDFLYLFQEFRFQGL